jgi:FkbH-like protein
MLYWVEHCVECAAPDCFESCDLYQPRTDTRCRRFLYGAMKNRNFSSLRGYGVEISFKKWAKIEAYGNLSLFPVKTVLWSERLIGGGAPIANAFGKVMANLTNKSRWNSITVIAMEELVRRLDSRKGERGEPDAFLLEIYNPGATPVRMQLNFAPVRQSSPPGSAEGQAPAFVTTVDVPAGYSRHQVEMVLLRFITAAKQPFVISMIPEADCDARLVFLTADFVQFAAKPEVAHDPKQIKCVVFDLDNTLWKGVLVESDSLVLRPDIVPLLRELDSRGILLSIASKNDYAAAWRKILECGVGEYFVFPQIHWAPKSQSIRTIAEQLNIGLDAFAFVDDSGFELEEVAQSLPEVLCLNAERIPHLLRDARFVGGTSADARNRRKLYQEAAIREAARAEYGPDYVGFVASCGITLEIVAYSHEDSERIAELVQRTNQLNFSGRKYAREQLEAILADDRLEKLVLRSSDRYGSYGTVGFAIVERAQNVIRILDFMLSCRVQGRLIEQAFFSHLLEHHNPDGAENIWINFRETPRNKPAHLVLKSLGFTERAASADGLPAGLAHSARESLRCGFIDVRCAVDAKAPATLPPDPILLASDRPRMRDAIAAGQDNAARN